jgi:hypothetical protein
MYTVLETSPPGTGGLINDRGEQCTQALSTASHLPTFDDAANPGAPKPLHKLDANSIILTLILLVVTYNATRNSVYTHNQSM